MQVTLKKEVDRELFAVKIAVGYGYFSCVKCSRAGLKGVEEVLPTFGGCDKDHSYLWRVFTKGSYDLN